MTREQANIFFASGYLKEAEIIKNPGNTAQWYVLLLNTSGKAYMLEDDQGQTLVHTGIDPLLSLVREIGFHQVLVHL